MFSSAFYKNGFFVCTINFLNEQHSKMINDQTIYFSLGSEHDEVKPNPVPKEFLLLTFKIELSYFYKRNSKEMLFSTAFSIFANNFHFAFL